MKKALNKQRLSVSEHNIKNNPARQVKPADI